MLWKNHKGTLNTPLNNPRVVFPEFNYQWLVDEIKENLPRELNFQHEAANAERCRANFASAKSRLGDRVHIPETHPRLSSRRVLTMEFISGARVTDAPALAALGVPRPRVAALVSEAFNEMIFVHGDVHCDPHAANMLVRLGPDGREQLVLLDHGLYKRLDDGFRAEYAALWRSLVFGDAGGIKNGPGSRRAAGLGFGRLLACRGGEGLRRLWAGDIVDKRIDHLTLPKTDRDKEMLQGYAQVYMREIGDLLLRMPRPLLLLLKTNDCLRSVDGALGSPLNTVVMTARECTRALSDIRSARSPGLRSALAAWLDAAHVEAVVAAMRAASAWAALRRAVWGAPGPRGGRAAPAAAAAAAAEAAGEGDGAALPRLQKLPAEFVAATNDAGARVAAAA
ncbi:hypothetical protein Rsub_01926 [Raphidocelis subcapitata]|uniref:ABC1 atypical kinase-like domain-containing protein n=1 Tax=Raphidocelis subcapitata TaxID=307507 RepID=A0A2V0NPK9_9CHLO|nr:hypothetical protein Rsub_01926 [Raphidocelis subcapitata]|eukprot:GBF89209.1 hypothetical protein Rsub_01926 [Raphidocelis subcapitata]